MTTTVVISSPTPNDQKVGVVVESGESSTPMIVLDDGESTVAYVHDGARLVITEVARDAATDQPVEAAPPDDSADTATSPPDETA